ncbi:MAG: hypothetical protein AAF718_11730 [Pseudomonadota bacterium]
MSRPLQNRVLATGEIVAHTARGRFMGNRGILHDDAQRLGKARWRHKAWVTCVLSWKDWHREVMTPGTYTELFFLDEAVALAAGHRPCGLCRHGDYNAYRDAANLSGPVGEMDRVLHDQRAIPRRFEQRRMRAEASVLPDGAIILDQKPKLIWQDALYPVGPDGYGEAEPRVAGEVTVLTPALSLDALAGGYRPSLAIHLT